MAASPLPAARRVLVLAPHADDEVFGCGGTLYLLAQAGAAITVIVASDGALGGAAGKTIGVLGLSFKPETDDIRESPALTIVEALRAAGARVQTFDPVAMPACRPLWPDVTFCDSPYEAARDGDALVIVTEWNSFRFLDLGRLKELLRRPLIVDLRNIYEPGKMAAAGFEYVSVGRRDGRPT